MLMHADVIMQMLWWGMDEVLAVLFTRLPSAGDFEGNPRERFRVVIDGVADGPDRMPRSIGSYAGWYKVEFRPGESVGREVMCSCDGIYANPVLCVSRYGLCYHKNWNDLLEVEWMGGDPEMMEEEYKESQYPRSALHPESGGLYFRTHLDGAGYHCRTEFVWTLATVV
jgi:hypothetical protein